MPLCNFGSACTRKDCVYRHPPKKKPIIDEETPICIPFLIGECKFGKLCRNRHVTGDEAEKIRLRNANTPCRFGSRCETKGCLFAHPLPELCPNGSKCVNPYCSKFHQEEEEEEDVATTAPAPPPIDNKPAPLVFPKSKALLEMEQEQTTKMTKYSTIRVPIDVWVPDYRRNPSAFVQYGDPIEKFFAVNKTSPKGVIDLHYQTIESVIPILEGVLSKIIPYDWKYYENNSIWIVTGAGAHTIQKGRLLIFDVVLEYLEKILFHSK